jgi:hypothetical protein
VPDIGVAVYAHLHRTRSPTGVGQHLTQMIKGLARVPGVEMMVIAPRNQLDETGRIPLQNPLAGIPARGLPLDRRWLEAMWERLDRPRIDHWCRGVDWVYSPTEAYIALIALLRHGGVRCRGPLSTRSSHGCPWLDHKPLSIASASHGRADHSRRLRTACS